jgi:hypothetical protein
MKRIALVFLLLASPAAAQVDPMPLKFCEAAVKSAELGEFQKLQDHQLTDMACHLAVASTRPEANATCMKALATIRDMMEARYPGRQFHVKCGG